MIWATLGVKELLQPDADTASDFVVFVKADALEVILQGELSPLEALFRGALRYCGDEQLGVAILRQLGSNQDDIFEPCRDSRW